MLHGSYEGIDADVNLKLPSVALLRMSFIVVLQPKGWIATIRYMYTLYNTIKCDKDAT